MYVIYYTWNMFLLFQSPISLDSIWYEELFIE